MPRIYAPSKYQPIWDQLKAEGESRIVAPLPFHARIKKAVIKRKDKDLGFKLELSEQCKYVKLDISTQGNTIRFKLLYYSTFQLGAF